jgi:hypothetical protein
MNKICFEVNGGHPCSFINGYIKGELYSNKHIKVCIDCFPTTIPKKEDDIWIYLQIESTLLSETCITRLMDTSAQFDKILTWDVDLLKKNSNAIKCMTNNQVYWVRPTIDLQYNLNLPNAEPIEYSFEHKKFQVSMLCGHKKVLPGHQLRRAYWENQNKITIPKKFVYGQRHRGLTIFKGNAMATQRIDKTELFIDSMFHIAIENNKDPNYFTEKLIDCIVSKTIPIYYGCPNIGEYFDIRGFVIIDSIDDICMLNDLTEEYYNDRKIWVEENYQKLLKSPSFKDQFINIITNNFGVDIVEEQP